MKIRRHALGGVFAAALFALTALGLNAAAAPGTTVSGTFVALTYNVAGLPEGLSGSEPDVNTPLISPLLNAYDLVLVQEDWIDPVPPLTGINFHHDDLISRVDFPYLSTPATAPFGHDPRRPEALVADGLNRLSRFSFGPVTRVMWDGCFGGTDTSDGGAADCASQKGFSVARTTLAPGVEADVYNLHGEAGRTPSDEVWMQNDFAQLAAYINANSAGHAVIVAGDTNLHTDRSPDGGIWQGFLAATGLSDVCESVDCGTDGDVIDKFAFRSGGGVTLGALTHTFERARFTRDDGIALSDHDPLAVTFTYSAEVTPTTSAPVTTSPATSAPMTVPSTTRPEVQRSVVAAPIEAVPRFTG